MRIGCSVIGILLVVLTLGIAAALTVSSLGGNSRTPSTTPTTIGGGTPTTSAATGIPDEADVVACQADVATVENAIQEYSDSHGIASTAVTAALLTSGPSAYLKALPSSPAFTISIAGGTVMVAAPSSAAPVPSGTAGACAKAAP